MFRDATDVMLLHHDDLVGIPELRRAGDDTLLCRFLLKAVRITGIRPGIHGGLVELENQIFCCFTKARDTEPLSLPAETFRLAFFNISVVAIRS